MIISEIQALLADSSTRRIHCIGLGGVGVGGIAEWLSQQGFDVSGSDLSDGARLRYYRDQGITVFIGHDASHVDGVDLVVYTSAAGPEHPERAAAKKAGVPICSRGEALAALVNGQTSIAVSGTHGKTTTTSLLAHALKQASLPVSYYVGGTIGNSLSTIGVERDGVCVMESDESDASFLHLTPTAVIVTNIDADHLGTYNHSVTQLQESFCGFVNSIPDHGLAILCGDDPGVQAVLPDITVNHCTYGFSEGVDYRVLSVEQNGLMAHVTWQAPDTAVHTFDLPMPGSHNALNALAACIAQRWVLQTEPASLLTFSDFPGVARRFTVHGDYAVGPGSAMIVEDYGHHPTEITATIQAVRSAWPKRRLVMVFQPHRYSRTAALMDDFVASLALSDRVLLLPIYAASEEPIRGVDSVSMAKAIEALSGKVPQCVSDREELFGALQQMLEPNDVLVFQGAGNVGAMAKALLMA